MGPKARPVSGSPPKPAAGQSPNLAHFLVKAAGQDKATADLSGPWGQITQKASFVATNVTPQPSTSAGGSSNTDNDVVVAASAFWNFNFSSQGNLSFFRQLPVDDTLENNAWIGDEYGCR